MLTKLKLGAAAMLLSLVPGVAFGQAVVPSSQTVSGPGAIETNTTSGRAVTMPAVPCVFLDASSKPIPCSTTNPLPVTSAGGGGSSDASAANQTTQITAANLTNTTLGAVTASPAANTIGDRLKAINTTLGTPLQAGGNVAITGTIPVTGTFYQATQPISAVALPLPTGAATSAKQDTLLTAIGTPLQAGGSVGVTGSVAVTGTFFQATQPVSATALPLPTGASTETTLAAASAKLPASLGAKTGATSLSVVSASDGFQVLGNIANNTADSGNPIKVGGYAGGTIPTTVGTGSRVNLWLGVNGQTVIGGTAFTGADATSNSMAQSTITSGSSGLLATGTFVSNGTTWDRQRGDTNGTYTVDIPVATAGAGIAPVVTSAVAGTIVGKASAGNLYGLNVVAGASAGFVLITNTTTAPADGAVTPTLCYPVAANGLLNMTFPTPVAFTTGISVSFSTTGCFSKTASATAFMSVSVK